MARILAPLFALLLAALPAAAAVSPPAEGVNVSARLVTAEDGVAGGTLSAGLALELAPGWKTYWRTPGAVGLPPSIDWEGSRNVEAMELLYPAPTRFRAFDIENYGYEGAVTFPLAVTLREPGASTRLAIRADLLVCAELCIPETVELRLDLPPGAGVDGASADALAEWAARVPGAEGFALEAVHLDGAALTLRARADAPVGALSVFPEQDRAAFGAPETRVSPDGRTVWARLPVEAAGEGPLALTLVAEGAAATLPVPALATAAPLPPEGGTGLWGILAVALLGGLILNLMPCVLPVLSLKLASALAARDRDLREVRAGFLAAAAGVMAFFVLLAGAVAAARGAGVAVGWGVQFQQPVFLAVMIALMALFAANLFGLFAPALPSGAATALGRAGAGRWGDFATGAFAAVMATPCSAPFIGTAVAFALTRGEGTTLAVFAAMGLGLAVPYLAVAARPALVRRLPRPGRWMNGLKAVLGVLMLVAAAWLVTVLGAAAGWGVAGVVAAAAAAMLLALRLWGRPLGAGALGVAAVVLAAVLVPASEASEGDDGRWATFSEAAVKEAVDGGAVAFVDVTADWCLTCKANKALVLDRAPVADALDAAVALRADWTRPDPAIAAFLERHGRYGIPFNAVYGPGAPDGIALPEILSERAVLDAMAEAAGR
ncbi:protein-disulfide reductase DsbD [Jannaschia sp. W003]|uniref:protein-disulfide reductase DsbD family protein n=1 Tax=Jannaschia sp. W003 TaxID=2867012 RepID=UPI0021A92AF1|nr:protein-disulfide reductase DsbD domain-containing protein [Jannaschia sp. W003]UWQ20052.1 thioredoxin family protein [Jannaschia sp. W003]